MNDLNILKRTIDIMISIFIILFLFPLFVVIPILILIESGRPILFMQRRVGLKRKDFDFYKFRTMISEAPSEVHREFIKALCEGKASGDLYKLKDDPRITKVGKFLRKFSIDELPQIFNVLKGDMSIVGPRPAIPYELEIYNQEDFKRFDVKPGITGLWQVNGRNLLDFRTMLKIDRKYVENHSLALDLVIILKTPFIIIFKPATA